MADAASVSKMLGHIQCLLIISAADLSICPIPEKIYWSGFIVPSAADIHLL